MRGSGEVFSIRMMKSNGVLAEATSSAGPEVGQEDLQGRFASAAGGEEAQETETVAAGNELHREEDYRAGGPTTPEPGGQDR